MLLRVAEENKTIPATKINHLMPFKLIISVYYDTKLKDN
jgi:hypothetical protein